MSDLVRAKHPTTGAEFTTSRAHAENNGLQVVDKPTHDRHGRIVPAKAVPAALRRSPADEPASKSKPKPKPTTSKQEGSK